MIVAYDRTRAIGKNGDMPWGMSLKADLKHFRTITTGKTVIMGRNTFESIGRPLPNRQNIVISRTIIDSDVQGVDVVHSLDDALAIAQHDVMIIGGGQLYESALEQAEYIYATEIDAGYDGADVFFPHLGDDWREVKRQVREPDAESNHLTLAFVEYARRT